MNKLLIITLMLFAFASCKTAQQPVITVPIEYKERIVEKLVPFGLPTDSADIRALFECNNLNQVIMKNLTEEKSKRIKSLFSFNDGVFKYNVNTVFDTVYVKGKDVYIDRDVPVYINVPGPEVNKLTKWQSTQIMAGRLFLGLILLFGVYKVVRWKFKTL